MGDVVPEVVPSVRPSSGLDGVERLVHAAVPDGVEVALESLGVELRHVPGQRVGIDERTRRSGIGRHLRKLLVGELASVVRPGAPALLQRPQPHEILQQPDLATRAERADTQAPGHARR